MDYRDNRQRWTESHQVVHFYAGQWCTFTPALTATRVVRYFVEQGIFPKRLKAAGFAATRPKVTNRKEDGTPIPENQAENRRVFIRVYPMSLEERKAFLPEMGVEGRGVGTPNLIMQEEGQRGQSL